MASAQSTMDPPSSNQSLWFLRCHAPHLPSALFQVLILSITLTRAYRGIQVQSAQGALASLRPHHLYKRLHGPL